MMNYKPINNIFGELHFCENIIPACSLNPLAGKAHPQPLYLGFLLQRPQGEELLAYSIGSGFSGSVS